MTIIVLSNGERIRTPLELSYVANRIKAAHQDGELTFMVQVTGVTGDKAINRYIFVDKILYYEQEEELV